MIKKILVFIAMAPFFLVAQDGFSGRGQQGKHGMEHRRQHTQEHHATKHEKVREKIEVIKCEEH